MGVVALLLVSFPLETTLRGDVFRLKDGRRIEGNIIREIGDLVSIRTADKVLTIDRGEIVEQIAVKTAFDRYQEKLSTTAEDDLAAQLALARWCASEDLASEATLHYKIVVGLAPDLEEAREKLGHIWFAGDWYLDGSAELEARRAELESTPAEDLPKIPDQLPPEPTERMPRELPPVPFGSRSVALTLDEKLGREAPKNSGVAFHVDKLLRSLDEPLRVSPGLDPAKAPFEIRVKVRCFFVRTQTFYNAPIYHVYQGEAEADIFERAEDGTTRRVGHVSAKKPFSSSVKVPKEKALQYTYYATCEELAVQLARSTFLRSRGVKAPAETPRR